MNSSERSKKLKELEFELSRAQTKSDKSGSSRIKQIKKIIARILTINNQK
jgi:ribosomal protein L29